MAEQSPAEQQIDISVGSLYDGQRKTPLRNDQLAAKEDLEKRVGQTSREQLLALKAGVARRIAELGIFGDKPSEIERTAAFELEERMAERVREHLEGESAVGRSNFVWMDIERIDPYLTVVAVPETGGKAYTRVRQSVGLDKLPNQAIDSQTGLPIVHTHPPCRGKFPFAQVTPGTPDHLVLNGFAFRRGAIAETLAGGGLLKPMWFENGLVQLPLIDARTQKIHIITISETDLPKLRERLEEERLLPVDSVGGSHVGKVRAGSPDEDSYFIAADGKVDSRLAHAESGLARANADGVVREQKGKAEAAARKISAAGARVWVVADGMGGEKMGTLASQRTVFGIAESLAQITDWSRLTSDEVRVALEEAVKSGNKEVFRIRSSLQPGEDVGSTAVVALEIHGQLYVANVGDSRAYIQESGAGGIRRLTKDHSLVQGLADSGTIPPDEVYTHPQRNLIYRSLGGKQTVDVDVFDPIDLKGGEKLLVCCDGGREMVRDPQLAAILAKAEPSSEIVKELIRAANDGGGEDNITAVVANFGP